MARACSLFGERKRAIIALLPSILLTFAGVSVAEAASISLGGGGAGGRVSTPLRSFKELRDRNVVKQNFDYSCGAAALATLLTYGMGDPTTELEVVSDALETLDLSEEALRRKEGFSLLDMQRVAQRRGYRAEGFRLAPEDLGKVRGPVIVFINPRGYEHFAVLRGVRGDRVYLADPSLGNVRRADYDFLDMWLGEDGKGVIFVVEPENAAPPSATPLALADIPLPRPELMSVRQLMEVGRASRPAGAFAR